MGLPHKKDVCLHHEETKMAHRRNESDPAGLPRVFFVLFVVNPDIG
jgi:hypothetical protein